jgi:tetratricopeptide (TPR) repeat protein
MLVLQNCLRRHPSSAKAAYYLGNLYYDKRRYDDAIRCWRQSLALDSQFSIPLRNLGIAEFNVLHDSEAADRMYALAFKAKPDDARVLYEWDQLRKRANLATAADRLQSLQEHSSLAAQRDDLTVEYITLLNQCGRWGEALEQLSARQFSPWEGGEGLVSAQYVCAHRELGREALAEGNAEEALAHFEAARHYPHNLGEGKHLLTPERDLDYFSGLAAQDLGDSAVAMTYWKAAAARLPGPGIHSYYQALALRELGRENDARTILKELGEFAAKQRKTVPKIDYFATSLPNLLLFEDDLVKRNRVDSIVLSALAHLGLGDTNKARRELETVLKEAPNHPVAAETLRWLKPRTRRRAKVAEVQPG